MRRGENCDRVWMVLAIETIRIRLRVMSYYHSLQSNLLAIIRGAGWAPAAVLVLHAIVVRTAYRTELDGVNHFLGGAAIAFFFLQAMRIVLPEISVTVSSYIFSFALACTIAVFWEIGEYASDHLLRTHVQISLSETMSDLIFGVTGAAVMMAGFAVLDRIERPSQSSEKVRTRGSEIDE